jgi:hypothetical protein
VQARRLGIPEWQLEAALAVPTSVIDDLVSDSRPPYTVEAKPSPEPVRGTGWAEQVPLATRRTRQDT